LASDTSDRLAALIDADNAAPAVITGLLAEVAKYGTAHVLGTVKEFADGLMRGMPPPRPGCGAKPSG
jgi:hypothetical protein